MMPLLVSARHSERTREESTANAKKPADDYNINVKPLWLWNIFCALSLLISATGVMLLPWSFFVLDSVARNVHGNDYKTEPFRYRSNQWTLISARGEIALQHFGMIQPPHPGGGAYWDFYHSGPAKSLLEPPSPYDRSYFTCAGFQWQDAAWSNGNELLFSQQLTVPLWLFVIFAIPPLLWYRQFRRRGRRGFPVEAREGLNAETQRAPREI